jgi:hypothetical protein
MLPKLYNYLQLLILLICIVKLFKTKQPYIQWLLLYIFITFVIEVYGRYLGKGNQWIFTLYLPLQFSFFSFLYYSATAEPKAKKIILFSSVVFFLFALINILFIQKLSTFNYYTILLSSLLLIGFSLFYFFEMIVIARYHKNLFFQYMFWLSLSCLIFFVGCFLYFSAWDILVTRHVDNKGVLYRLIFNIVNIIHYSLLSISAIVIPQQRKLP